MLAARHAYQDKSVTFIFALFAIVSPLCGRKLALNYIFSFFLFHYLLSFRLRNEHPPVPFSFQSSSSDGFLLVFARWQTVPRPGKCPTNFLLFSLVAMKNWVLLLVETKKSTVFSLELSSECCYQLFI
jgi:hypothetical protein